MSLAGKAARKAVIAGQLALLLIAAAILLPAITPGQAVSGAAGIKLLFLARAALLIALASWLLHMRALAWPAVGLRKPDWRRFLLALAAGLLITMVLAGLAGAVVAQLGIKPPNYAMFAPIRANLGEYLFWLIPVTLGSAALGEEMLFRGFITDALLRLSGQDGVAAAVAAIVIQAIIFGGLHFYQGPGGMIMAGSIGLALGLTWLIAGRNLWAGIVIHALVDGTAMTAIYLGYV